ncbi:hypothetical protein [Tessaracoccus palaemonis]|uniref:Uncharacterized protein n=1 Tax=Tessaracoccus palaemonis TaxID=2829499 RepID=A0ABX8SP38_9ACTN|nr:hypothetical protein [Tessaracoccus palaemonis]QXT63853.1 hypothetical protein KDB89_05145 [Tessaracoccus palaemonis]
MADDVHVFENSSRDGVLRYSAFTLREDGTAAIEIHDIDALGLAGADEYESTEAFTPDQVDKMCAGLSVTRKHLVEAVGSRFASSLDLKAAFDAWGIEGGSVSSWF